MERSIIEKFNKETLNKYGLDDKDQNIIKKMIDNASYEDLYSTDKENNHNINHIERIIAYTIMIGNKEGKEQTHGSIAAVEFMNKKRYKMDEKTLKSTSLLIAMHSEENDKITLKDPSFNEKDIENLQLMSNILKDANALDRNRETSSSKCDPNKLRTEEAKELLSIADSFYNDYRNYENELESNKSK